MAGADSKVWTIFVSFRHTPRDLFISRRVVEALNRDPRGVRGRRIVDRPAYSTRFRDEIDGNLSDVDGELVLWSPEARDSYYVVYEISRTTKLGIPICLVKYPNEPYPGWWGSDRHAIELKGIDARDPEDSLPWTDERQAIGAYEFVPFLNECTEFAAQVAAGTVPRLPALPEPMEWEYGMGWTAAERDCPIHRWSVRVVHTSERINDPVFRRIIKDECRECEVCQRGIAFSRDRSAGGPSSGSAWQELQSAVFTRHGQ